MRRAILLLFLVAAMMTAGAQEKAFDCTLGWLQKIEKLAPAKAEVQPAKTRKVLIFDRFTGFDHWVIPHTSQVIKMLGQNPERMKPG